jgi:ribosomal protein S12 methylthiotransferase accessory factor
MALIRSQAESLGVRVLVIDRRVPPDHVPERGDLILALVEPGPLALVPAAQQPRELLSNLLAFSDALAGFGAFERRWSWSSLLAWQLASALAACVELLSEAATGASAPFYVYLNGAFQRRYFPRWLAAAAPVPRHCETAAEGNCRGVMAHPRDIVRVFGAESAQNCTMGFAADQQSAYCYNRRLAIVGIGRGRTEEEMLMGAALELAERWVATQRPSEVRSATQRTLGAGALPPHQVWGLPEAAGAQVFPEFSADVAIDWLRCKVEPRGLEQWLPLEMVNYLWDAPRTITRHRNSNGCALGNSPAEATLFAALEVIERDALLLTWYSGCAPPRFELTSIDHAPTVELLRLLALRGYEVAMFDMTSEFDVPAVLVLLQGAIEGSLATFTTAASHPNPRHSIYTALGEAYSLIAAAEHNQQRARQLEFNDHSATVQQYLRYADARHLEPFAFLLRLPPTLQFAAFVAAHPFTDLGAAQALESLLARLAVLDYEMIICDNTPAALRALQLSSARVYIPGTLNLTFGGVTAEHIPPERFRRAARYLSWMDGDCEPRHGLPHPLG